MKQRILLISQKIRSLLLRVSGYLIPLVTQIPNLGIYASFMTVPLIIFLIALFSQFPANILEVFMDYLSWNLCSWSHFLTIILGFLIFLSSLLYLFLKRKQGLVTTGPYRVIRHPQYLGLLLMTLGLTAWSYWILSVTRGVGWLTSNGTIALWYAILGAYVILANIEELYLIKTFGEEYISYREEVPFLLPIRKPFGLDLLLSIVLLSMLLHGAILLEFIL